MAFRIKDPRRLILFLIIPMIGGCGESEPTLEETLAQASAFDDQDQPEQAVVVLRDYLEHDPDNVEALEALAMAHASLGNPAEAGSAFARIAQTEGDRAESWLFAAQSFLEAGEYEDAQAAYMSYLEDVPRDGAVWASLGKLHVERGRSEEAINAFLQANRHRQSASVALSLGNLYLEKQNYPQARVWLRTAMERDGEQFEPEALLGLLEIAIEANQLARAEELATDLQRRFPGTLEASRLAGVTTELDAWRARQQEATEAAQQLTRGIQREAPSDAAPEQPPAPDEPAPGEPAREVARQEAQAAETTEPAGEEEVIPPTPLFGEETTTSGAAEETPAELPATQAGEAPAVVQQARAAREQGNLDGAVRLYKRALARDDTDAQLWFELSRVYSELGRYELAEAMALEAERRDPENLQYALQRLSASQHIMSPRMFLAQLENLRARFRNYPDVTLALARAYRNIANNPSRAIQLYEEFLRTAPGHPEETAAQEELRELQSR